MNRLSRRAQRISPFLAMEILERATVLERSGRSIVHLEIGEPDFDTPVVIREVGVQALREGHTHYTHSLVIRNCARRLRPGRLAIWCGRLRRIVLW